MKNHFLALTLMASALLAAQVALAQTASTCTVSMVLDTSSSQWGDGAHTYCFVLNDENYFPVGSTQPIMHIGATNLTPDVTSVRNLVIPNCDTTQFLMLGIIQLPPGSACPTAASSKLAGDPRNVSFCTKALNPTGASQLTQDLGTIEDNGNQFFSSGYCTSLTAAKNKH